jgi:hypothetical protein
MDEQYELQAPWRYRRIKQAWYHKMIIHSLKNHYNLKYSKELVMLWSLWEEYISITYLKTKYQDKKS